MVSVHAGGLRVEVDERSASAAAEAVRGLVADRAPQRLAAHDATLWGPDAQDEAAVRLGWLDLPESSRRLLPELRRLADRLRGDGVDRVVLAGMGGSSLAPEVITATAGRPLTVLDTTDPGQIHRGLGRDLERTVVVVSSKSGTTVETDSHRRTAEAAFTAAGIDPAERIVVVTDPGTPLARLAGERGYARFLAEAAVGGRFSALSAFGLVPAALAGVELTPLLDQASTLQATLSGEDPESNPALLLGAALAAQPARDKLLLSGQAPAGLGDWIEQLIAESTGKQGRGLLPVVLSGEPAGDFSPGPDRHLVGFGTTDRPPPVAATTVTGELGAQFLAWEYAVALAGRLLGIDPFNQPNVAESKDNTARLLESGVTAQEPLFTEGDVAVFAGEELAARISPSDGLAGVVRALLAATADRGYVAVMAYLDRFADADAARLRGALAARTTQAVTFGWGPRFLHSTGQYHKGGPPDGSFLQLTGEPERDVAVPGRDFGFAALQRAQALGDFAALDGRGRPAVRLHLSDRAKGIAQVRAAIGSVTSEG